MTLPAGFTLRPLTLEDVDAAFQVVLADHASVLNDPDDSRESIRAALTSPDAVWDEHRIVLDAERTPVGLLAMEREGNSDRSFFDAYAIPAFKSQLLPMLLELGYAAGKRIAPGEVRSAGHLSDEALMSAFRDAGFISIRRYWRMQRDLGDVSGDEPAAPIGISKSVARSERDRRLLHSVHVSGFAEHFGSTPTTYEEWSRWIDDRSDARHDQRWLVWLDGEAVAESIGDDSRAEFGQSYVRTLSVLKPTRGRGIARWLLECHFAQAVRDGRTGTMLTVDAENTTGATKLYESVGMVPVQIIEVVARS